MSFVGIFILSSAVLMFEMALIRVFSVVLYPGLSFFGIAVAMFGITIGGILAFKGGEDLKSSEPSLYFTALCFFFSLSVLIFGVIFFSVDPAYFFGGPYFLFGLAAIPFIAANICLSQIFLLGANSAGKWYSADLLGAGAGVLASVTLMNFISTPDIMLVSACLSVVAGMFFYGKNNSHNYRYVVAGAGFIFILSFLVQGFFSVKYSKSGPEIDIIFEKWNSFSRITVAREDEAREILSMPQSYDPEDYGWKQYGIAIDSDAYTSVIGFNGDTDGVKNLRQDLSAAVYSFKPKGKALIIGVGGGRDVLTAVIHGWQVKGIDINPIIVNDVARGLLKDFSGNLYGREDVDITVAEGRSFIQRDGGYYDAINLPLVDTWASTVNGNLSLVESYLYTAEAFKDYFKRLNDDGVLTISRWSFDGDRLISLFGEAAREMRIENIQEHVVILSRAQKGTTDPLLNNYLFKKSPFTADEIKTLHKFAEDRGFMVLSKSGNDEFPLSTDDKPFFFFRVSKLNDILWGRNFYKVNDGGLGITLNTAIIFALISLLLPWFLMKQERLAFSYLKAGHLAYFAILGFAFMLIEIGLIQKFILYLEYPIYSYSVVLAVMLIVAGFGSLWSSRLNLNRKHLFFSLFGLLLIYHLSFSYFAEPFLAETISMALSLKIIISVLMVSVPALIMGMFMPLGIRRLDMVGLGHLIPWAWAVNGAASILASVMAIVLAIFFGFSVVISIGVAAYLLVAIISIKLIPRG